MHIIQQLGYLAFSLNDNNLAFVSGKTGPRMVCRGSNGHPQKASDPWEMGPTSGKSWVLIQS